MKALYTVTGGMMGANSYVVTSDGSDCIVVDCADEGKLLRFLTENGLTCRALLLTHAHFDHCVGVPKLQKAGAKVYIHSHDVPLISGSGNLARAFGARFSPFTPDETVEDGEELQLCGMKIRVIHTPGHTPGGVCYLIDDTALFTGDTLFYMSVGRTDFPGGDARELRNSINGKLFTLGKNYAVYPGHGEETDLFFEKDNNPYV